MAKCKAELFAGNWNCMVCLLELAEGKAHGLWSGFGSTRVCHYCDSQAWLVRRVVNCRMLWAFLQGWWDVSLQAPWRAHRPGAPATNGSALAVVPGLQATSAPPDQMHTWHLGLGQVLAGGLIAARV